MANLHGKWKGKQTFSPGDFEDSDPGRAIICTFTTPHSGHGMFGGQGRIETDASISDTPISFDILGGLYDGNGRTKGSIAWENIIPYSGTGTAPESFKGHLTNGDNTLKGIWKLTDADKDTTGFYDDYHGHFVLHRVTDPWEE